MTQIKICLKFMKIYYMGHFYMLILTMHSKTGWEEVLRY